MPLQREALFEIVGKTTSRRWVVIPTRFSKAIGTASVQKRIQAWSVVSGLHQLLCNYDRLHTAKSLHRALPLWHACELSTHASRHLGTFQRVFDMS